MAKGKHATALFEVIHSARRPPQSSPAVKMPPPRSWWKGHSKRVDPVEDLRSIATAAAPDTTSETVQELAARSQPDRGLAASEAPSRPAAVETPTPHAISRESDYPESTYIDPADSTPIEPLPQASAGRKSEPALQVKTGGGEFSFRLSYGGAAAAAFILLLLVAIAFLIGTRAGDAPLADDEAGAASTSTAAGGAPGSGMLAAVTPAIIPAASATGAPEVPGVSVTSSTLAPPNAAQQIASAEPGSSSAAQALADSQHAVRQVGLDYVIIQSYPSQETAQRAADFLIRNGIACTIKQGLPGWTLRSWYTVVGIRPFDRVKQNPDFERYKDRLRVLGDAFAGHNTFNRFEPTAYKWRSEADDDAGQ